MTHYGIVWAWLHRKPTRTCLTMLSVVVGFFLFGMLQGVNAAKSVGMVGGQNLDRLLTLQSTGGTLPLADMERIKSVPGVLSIVPAVWLGGYFQDPKNAIFAVATDVPAYFAIATEKAIPSSGLAEASRNRTGAIVGVALAKKFGWKVGDRIPMRSDIWLNKAGGDWPVEIAAIYEERGNPGANDGLFLSFDYLDKGRLRSPGTVDWFEARIANAADAPRISSEIDALFENSNEPTRTSTEKEFTQAILEQAGDISLIATATLGAVFFTILIITANTMMQAFRERTAQFAVLKALGFSNGRVLSFILLEALVLCGGGAIVGLAMAAVAFPQLSALTGVAALPASVLASGLVLALLLGLFAGFVPAVKTARMPLAGAMAQR